MNIMDRSSDDGSDSDDNSQTNVTNSKGRRRRKVGFNDKSDDELLADANGSVFESYVIISFASDVNTKTLHWIVDKIRGKKSHGGAELLLRKEPDQE